MESRRGQACMHSSICRVGIFRECPLLPEADLSVVLYFPQLLLHQLLELLLLPSLLLIILLLAFLFLFQLLLALPFERPPQSFLFLLDLLWFVLLLLDLFELYEGVEVVAVRLLGDRLWRRPLQLPWLVINQRRVHLRLLHLYIHYLLQPRLLIPIVRQVYILFI